MVYEIIFICVAHFFHSILQMYIVNFVFYITVNKPIGIFKNENITVILMADKNGHISEVAFCGKHLRVGSDP